VTFYCAVTIDIGSKGNSYVLVFMETVEPDWLWSHYFWLRLFAEKWLAFRSTLF